MRPIKKFMNNLKFIIKTAVKGECRNQIVQKTKKWPEEIVQTIRNR